MFGMPERPWQMLFVGGCVTLVVGALCAFVALHMLSLFVPAMSPQRLVDSWSKQRTLQALIKHNRDMMWQPHTKNQQVWGYVNRHSIKPGERFHVMLARKGKASVRGRIEIFRVGGYKTSDRKRVWRSEVALIKRSWLTASAAALGPNWRPTFWTMPTTDWRSGYYAIDFVNEAGQRTRDVTFIVVTNPKQRGDILIKLSTNTYQAYNLWGGYSLYKSSLIKSRGQLLSFDRPTPTQFYRWEYDYVVWLERQAKRLGVQVDYVTDFDVHKEPRWTRNYQLFVSLGHDEYWTKEMFDHVYERIFRLGKNTLFLGANIAYWQVRYADINAIPGGAARGRQLVCFKSYYDPIRYRKGATKLDLTTRFRARSRRPESMLLGVAYQAYFRPKSPQNPKYRLYVVDTSLPFFRGVGYKKGDSLGFLLGYEWDNRDPEENGHRLWSKELSQIPRLPKSSIKLLFAGEAINRWGNKGKAESVYFVSKAGAGV